MNHTYTSNTVAVVLDVHGLFLESFSRWLESTTLFKAVETFQDQGDLLKYLLHLHKTPVLAFISFSEEEKQHILFMADVKRFYPQAQIVAISSLNSSFYLQKMLSLKVAGIVSKASSLKDIFQCIQAIAQKQRYCSDDIRQVLESQEEEDMLNNITPRELEALHYFAKGYSVNNTATEMKLSSHTVVAHRRNLMAKLKCHTIGALLAMARENKLI